MPKYVVLVNWTDKGVAEAYDTVKRAEQVEQLAERLGGHVDLLLWTLGRHDLICVADMPNDETMAAFAVKASAGGHVRTETLRAFTADEIAGIIGKAR